MCFPVSWWVIGRGCWSFLAITEWNWLQRGCCTTKPPCDCFDCYQNTMVMQDPWAGQTLVNYWSSDSGTCSVMQTRNWGSLPLSKTCAILPQPTHYKRHLANGLHLQLGSHSSVSLLLGNSLLSANVFHENYGWCAKDQAFHKKVFCESTYTALWPISPSDRQQPQQTLATQRDRWLPGGFRSVFSHQNDSGFQLTDWLELCGILHIVLVAFYILFGYSWFF